MTKRRCATGNMAEILVVDDEIGIRELLSEILGVAYKRDVGDVRESPALDVIHLLGQRGAEVTYHDPCAGSCPAIRMVGDQRTIQQVILSCDGRPGGCQSVCSRYFYAKCCPKRNRPRSPRRRSD